MRRSPSPTLIAMMLALAPLAGCVSFGAKPPPQLLTLSAPATVPTDAPAAAPALTVLDLDTPRKLDTVRVPVQVNDTSIAYVKDAQWVDTPRKLFRKLLSDRIAADGQVLVLEPGRLPLVGGRRLMGELVEFGVDARSGNAVVTYEAILVGPDPLHVVRRRFTASVPAGKIAAGTVARPINAAAQQVADQVAEWVKGN